MYINAAPQTHPHIHAAYIFVYIKTRFASLACAAHAVDIAGWPVPCMPAARSVLVLLYKDKKTTERLALCLPPYKRTTPACLTLPKATRSLGRRDAKEAARHIAKGP